MTHAWQALAFARINEPEQHQVAEQHTPVRTKPTQQTLPIQFASTSKQQVRDVGAVEPLALLDERLGPDHLFGRAQPNRHVEDVVRCGVREPLVVDVGNPVARAEDDVDEVLAVVGFAQPVRKRNLRDVAGTLKSLQRAREVRFADEDVQVLGVALDAGIAGEGIGSADQHVDAVLLEHAQRVAVELSGLGLQDLLRVQGSHRLERAHWQATCRAWARGAYLAIREAHMTALVRVAAVGDLHCTKTSEGVLQPLFAQMAECVDVIALAGDLVDYGLPEEAHVLVRELSAVLKAKVPVVAVLGNHDFEGWPARGGQRDPVQPPE